ncbi:MAG: ANTAR domain-containing protein [Lachnospiraceae bacterium]|nr:ANTAR domain-containing protein [Lachnospiraceae bacterium]
MRDGGCWTSGGCPLSTDRNGVEKDYMTLEMSYQEKFGQGLEQGQKQGIRYLVDSLRSFQISEDEIKGELMRRYHLSEEEAVKYLFCQYN